MAGPAPRGVGRRLQLALSEKPTDNARAMIDGTTNPIPAQAKLPGPSVANSPPTELPLLRFRLRHLFWIVAGVCVLMAGLVASSGITSLALLLAVIVAVAHVTATALGSRLRDHADHRRSWESSHAPHGAGRPFNSLSSAARPAAANSIKSAQPPLYSRRSSLRRLPLLVAAGALLGLLVGAAVLAGTIGHRTSAAGIAVGAVSLGIVGGWFALLGGCFWSILRQGWREAVAHQKQDEARRFSPR